MTVALALLSSQIVGTEIVKRYSVTLSSNYADSGTTGDTFNVQSTPTNPSNLPRAKWAGFPTAFRVLNHPAGWVMRIEPVFTAFAGWGLRFFQSDDAVDPLDEHANGAYAASITGSDGAPLQIELIGKNI